MMTQWRPHLARFVSRDLISGAHVEAATLADFPSESVKIAFSSEGYADAPVLSVARVRRRHMLDQSFLREAIERAPHFQKGAFVAPLQIDLLQPGSRQQNVRQNILPDKVRHIARVGSVLRYRPPFYCAGSSIAQSSPPVHSPERVR